ncbi:hypothetical protein CH296_18090 [Rhodococcus sp. 14-2496-1d]|nr:hypothetical protein CH296_18090 [Rhodococcus sp. 14-2496-1d]
MYIPLAGPEVVSMEFGFSLALQTNQSYELRIESSCELHEPGSEGFRGAPDATLSEHLSVRRLEGRGGPCARFR